MLRCMFTWGRVAQLEGVRVIAHPLPLLTSFAVCAENESDWMNPRMGNRGTNYIVVTDFRRLRVLCIYASCRCVG